MPISAGALIEFALEGLRVRFSQSGQFFTDRLLVDLDLLGYRALGGEVV